MTDGIINVYKEAGFTSHDVVAKLRGILHIKKIGHTGTLDPDATGVLPVCVGRATRVCDMLTDTDKTYEAEVIFGITSDTLDSSGTILLVKPVNITRDRLTSVLSQFIGETEQLPPMYSAVKVNGKKLYEYAREGKQVERKKRNVTIYGIELIDSHLIEYDGKGADRMPELPSAKIRVRCSKGTYIRSLCDDIGDRLGCGAVMGTLVRTAAGRFSTEGSLTLKEIEKTVSENDNIDDIILPIDEVFQDMGEARVKAEAMKLLINGNPLNEGSFEYFSFEKGEKQGEGFRVYGDDGEFYAVYKKDPRRDIYKVWKYFH